MSNGGGARGGGASGDPRGASPRDGSIWRFEAPDAEAAASWLASRAAAGITIRFARIDAIREAYYDTSDSRIFRSGYALCIRSAAEAHFGLLIPLRSGSDGPPGRLEIGEPIPSADADALLDSMGRVGEKTRTICGNRSLEPLGALEVTRRTYTIGFIADGKNPERFEGEIRIESILVPEDSPRHASELLRVEIESPEAPPAPSLSRFVEEMRTACALRPSPESRMEKILTLLPLAGKGTPDLAPARFESSSSVGAVALAVLRKQFASFLRHEPGARLSEDDEEIHDMRVAARRMRAALRLFGDYLPKRTTARAMRELRWIAHALGEVRDLDVQIAQIRAWEGGLLLGDRETILPLLDLLAKRRAEGRRKLLDILDSRRYDRDVATMLRLLRRGPVRKGSAASAARADIPIRVLAPILIRDHHKKLAEAARRIAGDSSLDDYHRVRIRCKRYRYALEFLEGIVGPAAAPMIASAVKVQDILGRLQDSRVAIARIRDIAASMHPRLPEGTLAALGEIAQLYARSGDEARASYPGAIRRVRGKRWRTVDRALGRLSEKAADALPSRLVSRGPHASPE